MQFPTMTYSQFLETIPDAAIVVDRASKIVLANSRAYVLFGYDPGELQDQSIQTLVPETKRETHAKHMEGFYVSPKTRPLGTRRKLSARRKDGSEFPTDILLSPVKMGGALLTVCIVLDITELTRAETALRQSEEKYRLLVEDASEVFYQVSLRDDPLRGQVEFVSQQTEIITGHSEAEFVQDPELWSRSLHPDDIGGVAGTTQGILSSRTPGTREYRIWHSKRREYRWVEDRVAPRFDLQGNVIGYQGVARDITKRKQAEVEMRLLLTATQAVGEAPDFHSALDVCLEKVCRSTGWAFGEAWIPLPDGSNLIPGPAWHSGDAALEKYKEMSQGFSFAPGIALPGRVWSMKRPEWIRDVSVNGEVFSRASLAQEASLRAALGVPILADGQVLAVLVFFLSDAREPEARPVEIVSAVATQLGAVFRRKQAEAALSESEERYRTLVETAPDSIIAISLLDGTIVSLNPAFETLTGWPREEWQGKPFAPLLHPDDLSPGMELFRCILQGETPPPLEWRVRHKSGDYIPIEFTSAPRLEHGQVVGLLGIARDITERKQRERELEAIAVVSSALRTAQTRVDMLPIILDQLLDLLQADAAALAMRDPVSGETVIELGRGAWAPATGARLPPGEGVCGRVIATGQPYLNNSALTDPLAAQPEVFGGLRAVADVPLIAREQTIGSLRVGRASDIAPEDVRVLTAIGNMAANAIHRAALHEQSQRYALELALAYDSTIEGWSHALDLRDQETEGHTLRVTESTLRLARAAGMTEDELVHVRRGALLHDIGKMGIPDAILLKPDKLTDEEWAVMRKHPAFAYELLSPIAYLRPALDIPYCHHEKWDGSGYPRGLKSEQIPLAARLFAVVDVWDALRSDRPYRQGWSEEKAFEYIRAQAGMHFDPRAVELFLQVMSGKAQEHVQGAG